MTLALCFPFRINIYIIQLEIFTIFEDPEAFVRDLRKNWECEIFRINIKNNDCETDQCI